ncbi:hypothetical protein BLNAU_21322 [Blattamonas nauphoetae]|uniref:Serine-threonine/tyrosine-protein kinase catalytic domain-containing protein n=1 Tax=Blattamonas nauphoetae TaxID=2049346 RepID=A0ABQ9WYH3_9EUKA|nr:hypothetical protein BLNAU_21322 [Blattamonas nauphoetae]
MLIPVLLVFPWSFCQPSDLSVLVKAINLSSNGVQSHSEIKLEESVLVSQPMTIVSQNIDFISTSDISTILPSKLVNDNKPLFSLSNSSLSFTSVAFTIADQIIATVDETSHFQFESCLLESNGHKLFEVDGTLILIQTTLIQPTTTSSLIVSPSTNGEVRLFACSLEQTHNIASSPILGDTLQTIQVCHCQIRNLTHSPVISSMEAHYAGQTSSLVVGNSFKFNEDVLDGNVFLSLNRHVSFTSLNNTYFQTRRTGSSNKERQEIVPTDTATDNLFSFTGDTFEGCHAIKDVYGGAISFRHSANLKIDACSFTSCFVTGTARAGAIFFASAASSGQNAQILSSNFSGCSSVAACGAIYTQSPVLAAYSSSISHCRFEGNKADHIDSFYVHNTLTVTIYNTIFEDCEVTRYEGPWKSENCYGTFESSSCVISHCTGTSNGQFGFRYHKGAISLKFWKIVGISGNIGPVIDSRALHTGQTSLADLSLEDCWFEAGDGKLGGLDVCVENFTNSLNQNKVVNCYSTNQPKSVVHFNGTENVRSSFLTVQNIIIDKMNGVDEAFCWVPGNGNGCKTLTDTLPRLSVLFEGKLLLKCDENSESVEMEESDLTIGERQLVVVGDGKDKVWIADKSTSVLFSITAGSFALSSVSLVPSPTSSLVEVSNGGTFELSDVTVDGADQTDAVFTKAFFVGTKGSFSFDSVGVSSFVFHNAASIQITNTATTHLTIQSSNFTSITRQEGSGVAVEASLTTNSKVTIENSRFEDCHSLDSDYTGLEITDPTISSPSAQSRGGIVRVIGNAAKPGSIEITDTHFASNSIAGGSGAGLYLNQIGSASITSCHFESLTADGIEIRGAALTSLGVITTTITSCDFLKCKISKNLYAAYSGAISVVQGQVIARDCNIAECSSVHMINAVFFNNISTGSSVENVVLRNCVGGHDIFFFVWSSSGLTLSNIHFIDCGIEEKEWAPLSFGFKSPNLASVDGLFVASSSSSLQKGRITINPIWLSETSSLSFSNCQLLCDEPFITEEKDFSSGFLAPQLRVAAEANLPTTIDETMCGHPSRACKTVEFALELCPSVLSHSEFVLIEIGEGEHEEDHLVIEKKIKLISSDVAKHALLKTKDTTGSLLTVKQNGILVAESLSIVLTPVDSGKAAISSSGTLTLTSVTFVNPSSSPTISGHLVEIAEGSGTISKCVIPACRLSQGTSIIQIQSGTSVDLKDQEVDLTDSELATFLNIVGTASIASSSFSNITSLSSFITGSGSLTILDSTFLSIKEKDSSLLPCRSVQFSVADGQVLAIGADSKPVSFTSCSSRGEGGALQCSISGSGILAISHTTFTECSSSKKGGACFVDLSAISTGSFRTGEGVSFTDCEVEDGNGNGLFIVCSDLQAFLTPTSGTSPLASIKPKVSTNSVFTDDQRKLLWGRETKEGGTEGSLLFYWDPHRTGAVHLRTGGEDHPLCGVAELPCSSLSQAMRNLKPQSPESDTPEVDIDSDLNLTSPLLSTAPNWILRGSLSNSFTMENEAQISIKKGVSSSLTLATLTIKFETNSASRSTPILDIQSGTIEMNDCSVNSDVKSISSSLFAVGGGSLILTKGSIATPSSSHPLLSITSGSFSVDTIQVIVTIQPTRSSPLISMSGGTSSISGPITSLISSHAAFSLSGTAVLKLVSNNDFSNGAVGSVVTMEGGKIEMKSSSFEKAVLSSSLISGSGSVSIMDCSFTSLIDSSIFSSNSESVRALTLSIGNNQKVEIGAESKPVLFTSCSSRGEGGALHCSISKGGVLVISHTTFDGCSSQQVGGGLAIVCEKELVSSSLSIKATFTLCSSSARPVNALHLTASSFESLIDSSRWIINNNQLISPDNNDVLWGEDLAEESESKYRSLTLLYYLFPYRHSEISTSLEGRDGEGCGHTTLPCSSFSTAHSHLVGDHTLTLVVMGKTRLDGTVSLSKQNLLIEPQGGVGMIVVSSNGQLLNIHPSSTSHTVTITHISFDLSSAQAPSLISSNNGDLSLTSCSITSSSTISAKLVSVSTGSLQITNLNLTGLSFSSIPIELSTQANGRFIDFIFSNTDTAMLLSASNSTVYLSQCKLSGTKQMSQTNEEEICGWSTGFVSLDNCTTTLTGSSFSHFGNGAIAMKDGKLEIDSSSFKENNPHLSDFPSLHRNIVCVGNGLIEISTLSGGDGSTDKLPSGWMKMEDDCSVLSDLVEPNEVFFIPSITKNVVGYDKKTKLFDLKIEGELLIPCGLSLEVFEVVNGTAKNSTQVDPLTLSPKNWTESSFSITLNETTLLNSLAPEPEWHARLLFGVDGTTTSFKLKESLAEIKKAQTTRTMKWLLPVIIGVSVVLILILLLVLLLWCRQHRKRNTPLASQAELNDLPEVMDEKMEMGDENTVGTTAFVFDKPADAKSESFVPLNAFNQPGPISEELPSDVAVIQGMMMDGREETVQINRHHTLFNRLHRPAQHHQNHSIDKKSVEAQIAAGLVQFDVFNLGAFLSNFSPHSIIVQDNNAVIFNLSHDEKQGTTLQDGKTGNDAQRWQAPELAANGNENDDQKNTNAGHGAVFSLGLVLWEIETELVPFRELDAANAQRALATGTGLDLSLVSDEALRGKIEECLSLHTDKRPKLSDLSSFLDTRVTIPKPLEASDKRQNVQLASKI